MEFWKIGTIGKGAIEAKVGCVGLRRVVTLMDGGHGTAYFVDEREATRELITLLRGRGAGAGDIEGLIFIV